MDRRKLKKLVDRGIQVDEDQLIEKVLGKQFRDKSRSGVETVTNALDAGATEVYIEGREEQGLAYITFTDNGRGMDETKINSFTTVFKSVKDDAQSAIGIFGSGRMSFSMYEDQCSLEVRTSTGKEAYRLKAGRIRSVDPIEVETIDPPGSQGTTITVAYKASGGIRRDLIDIKEAIEKYCRYLGIKVVIRIPREEDGTQFEPHVIYGNWEYQQGFLPMRETWQDFDIVLSLGDTKHEIYQKRVLVTDDVDLIKQANASRDINHLTIRVDSSVFELNLGRDQVLNLEQWLPTITNRLVNHSLPRYFEQIVSHPHVYEIERSMIEDFTIGLIGLSPSNGPWRNYPVFALAATRRRITIEQIEASISKHGKIYIVPSDLSGIDLEKYDSVVLSDDQASDAIHLLRSLFPGKIIDLGASDTVLEQTYDRPLLSESHKKFEAALRFDPEAMRLLSGRNKSTSQISPKHTAVDVEDKIDQSLKELVRSTGSLKEAQSAIAELRKIRFRVSYLVQRDGTTPCRERLFLYDKVKHTVVFNLHNTEVQDLVHLSEKPDALTIAGHWGLCQVLEDRVLPFISAELAEELMMLDAISKAIRHSQPLEGEDDHPEEPWMWDDFLSDMEPDD